MGDAEGDGVVVALAELVQQVRAEGGAAAGAGVLDGLVRLAQDGDDVACPGLQASGAELGHGPASPDDVLAALLDAGQPGQQVLVAGVAVGHQQPGERGRDARGDIALAPRGEGLQPGQLPVWGPDDQHVRGTRSRLLLVFRSCSPPSSRAAGCGAFLPGTFTGVSSAASASWPASAASIASSNPALPSCAASRALALSIQPARPEPPAAWP